MSNHPNGQSPNIERASPSCSSTYPASRTASATVLTFMIGSVGPNVSSVMHSIEWSTSTSTVGS